MGGHGATGRRRSRPTTRRPSGCSASSKTRTRTPPTSSCASSARSSGVGDTYKRTPVGIFFGGRTARQDRRRPVLRRRGTGQDRLHAVRALHGRLPARRQEHARQELPVPRREARRAGDRRTHGRRHPPARLRRRQRTATRSKACARARGCARIGACTARARRGRRGGPAGHQQAAAALPPGRLAAAHLRAPGRAGAHELGVDPRRSPCPRTTPTT